MKRLVTGAAVAALSLVCLASVLCLSGCRDNADADAARKAGYQSCMDKAKAAGVLNAGTQPEIDAACQDQAQQAQPAP